MLFDIDDDIRSELAAEDAWEQRIQRRLAANPDCRDPDHPGCEDCQDE